jgi:hypothetical protein
MKYKAVKIDWRVFTWRESLSVKMNWCKSLCKDLRETVRGSPMIHVLITGIIIILGGMIAAGVYTITRDPVNIIAYIILGVAGICILFLIGMVICAVGCYSSPVVTTVITVPRESSPASHALHSNMAPNPPILVTPRASAPTLTGISGSNPMYSNV